jgi:putative oxidoreductase
MKDFGLLVLRLTLGSLFVGHGTQKLFGWFGGPGMEGTKGMMTSLGVNPPSVWGPMVAAGETSGGLLTALGFLSPMGPLNIIAAMWVAMRKVHWSNGIWNSGGGIEFPLVNIASAFALAMAGPGRFSLDRRFGTHLPAPLTVLAALMTAGIVGVSLRRPELAQKALDTASSVIPGMPAQSVAPDLERETRPQPTTTPQTVK